jgi:phosphoribosylanthranilate isomerase
MVMIVQIYEITSVEEAIGVAKTGADHVGVVVGDGDYENEVKPFKARDIFLSLPEKVKGVALTMLSDIGQIVALIKEVEPDILHLAGSLEEILPNHLSEIKKEFPGLEIMRTIPVIGEESVVASLMFDEVCDYLLLDTKDSETGQVGVTGATHDWEIDAKIVESVRAKVVVAGGLGPDNVQDAIYKIKPYGVDSKTKTDKTGSARKDLIKVKLFVQKAKSVTF